MITLLLFISSNLNPLDTLKISHIRFLIGDIKNETPLFERIKYKDISLDYINEKASDTIVLTDNSFFAEYDIKKHFEYMIVTFLSEYNSNKKTGKEYYIKFKIKNYGVYLLPNEEAIKEIKEANFYRIIGTSIFLLRMIYVGYKLRNVTDYSYMLALMLLTFVPIDEPLWWIAIIPGYLYSFSSMYLEISAKNKSRTLKGVLRAEVEVFENNKKLVLKKTITGNYAEKKKAIEIFRRHMIFKYKFKKDLIKKFMKKTELDFLNKLKEILDEINQTRTITD